MPFTPFLAAIVFALPAIATTAGCLGFHGVLIVENPVSPCSLTLAVGTVEEGFKDPCDGTRNTSTNGPWTGVCTTGPTFFVVTGATSATYTNLTGSSTLPLVLSNPKVFTACSASQFSETTFTSNPNSCTTSIPSSPGKL